MLRKAMAAFRKTTESGQPSPGRQHGFTHHRVVRLHRAALESCRAMQRILTFFSHLLKMVVVLGIVGLLQLAVAQNSGPVLDAAHQSNATTEPSKIATQSPAGSSEQKTTSSAVSSALVIGPGDDVEITVYGTPDLSEHTRVSADGNISMPLIDYVRIAGLSSSEAEAAIEARLRENKVLNDPHVSVYVKEYNSSGISVTGEVVRPGFYSALGPRRLFDVLQAAGGPTDKAANEAMISHRDQKDATTVHISKNPTEMADSNIELQPGDTVVVPKAGIVYVLGEVNRPGGYVLNSTGGITVLQVVAVAAGPTHIASPGKTRLLRRTENGFQEQQIDLKKLLRGKGQDVPLRNNDILFVPSSTLKEALNASTLVGLAATTAIYRVP
ncbi:MAG: polysaccharide biosynthesis/export family protein [Candidatus Sulfotelmatobacter sp.]